MNSLRTCADLVFFYILLFYIKFSFCFYSVALKATGWLYGSENTAQQELSTGGFTAEITVEVSDQLVYI